MRRGRTAVREAIDADVTPPPLHSNEDATPANDDTSVYKPHLTPPPVSAGVTKFLCATPALPHSQANCLGEDGEVAGERDHDVAVVRRDHVLERRDGARDRRLGDDREDAEHGEAAVVDLGEAPARL